jgi:hypothetical protein
MLSLLASTFFTIAGLLAIWSLVDSYRTLSRCRRDLKAAAVQSQIALSATRLPSLSWISAT